MTQPSPTPEAAANTPGGPLLSAAPARFMPGRPVPVNGQLSPRTLYGLHTLGGGYATFIADMEGRAAVRIMHGPGDDWSGPYGEFRAVLAALGYEPARLRVGGLIV